MDQEFRNAYLPGADLRGAYLRRVFAPRKPYRGFWEGAKNG